MGVMFSFSFDSAYLSPQRELLHGLGWMYNVCMETLEDMYARMMADEPERVQATKADAGSDADTLEELYAQRMVQEDAVRAANPYGCNQYGEGWKMPHNGMSRVPRGSVPQESPDKKRKRKTLTQKKLRKMANRGKNTLNLQQHLEMRNVILPAW